MKYTFIVKIKGEDPPQRIEGTRAEEAYGEGSLIVYDGDAVVSRFPDKVEWWTRASSVQPVPPPVT